MALSPIGVSIKVEGVDLAVQHISKKMNRLQDKMHTLANKLAEIGVSFMNVGFRTAVYDGTPDVQIGNPSWVSDMVLEIPVTGSTVAFIEFGTGVHYGESHPKAAELGAVRGEYGHKRGRNDTWKYYGDPGSMGWYQTTNERAKGLVTTHGNPPNSVMYNASKQMRMQILEIARSVFADD